MQLRRGGKGGGERREVREEKGGGERREVRGVGVKFAEFGLHHSYLGIQPGFTLSPLRLTIAGIYDAVCIQYTL